jgi:hypothetical protein
MGKRSAVPTILMRWLPSWRGEILAIALAFIFLAAAIAGLMFWRPYQKTNFGFGPDWECKAQPYSEPVCIKRGPPR